MPNRAAWGAESRPTIEVQIETHQRRQRSSGAETRAMTANCPLVVGASPVAGSRAGAAAELLRGAPFIEQHVKRSTIVFSRHGWQDACCALQRVIRSGETAIRNGRRVAAAHTAITSYTNLCCCPLACQSYQGILINFRMVTFAVQLQFATQIAFLYLCASCKRCALG